MKRQDARERIKNFFEVALGLDASDAVKEAARCLQCKDKPCVKGCPVEIDIPSFIRLLKEGNPKEALEKIKEKNFLPAVCGRVCPQEDQCEAVCVLNKKKMPINIGALERYAADHEKAVHGQWTMDHGQDRVQLTEDRGQKKISKVAVVGSGPAGLTCAAELAILGYGVTLFESLHVPGGVLSYGIPEFRLPKNIVHDEVAYIRSLGVQINTNILVGRTFTFSDLFGDGYKAIFMASGAGLPNFLGIEGENAGGVYSANEFLTRVNLMKAYEFPKSATPVKVGKTVVVIGGGNVALDSARCARRLGADVSLVYRRTENEMPARREEIENAKEEGVNFMFLTAPKKIIVDEKGSVKALVALKMELGAPDASGRPRPIVIKGSEFIIDTDTVVVAIGQSPNPLLAKNTPGLEVTDRSTIKVDKHYATSIKGVFAGGDIITGADTVISAMGAGKKAAHEIDNYIKGSHQDTRHQSPEKDFNR
ncbi:MAG: NADPH-dependent glutamate synthase [Candidatus Omnitrophica bacterium]|nr:NADPH-dependent glutamate synthase [Candidatus Omnitrophota bacterium]